MEVDIRTFLNSIKKEMEQGVYNFTDNGKCTSCGQCCSNILPMSKEEIKAIRKYKRKHHIQDTSKKDGVDINLVCPFRDNGEKICTIYPVRPLICRDFKCDKPQNDIKATRDLFYESRETVYVRETFFEKKEK